MPVPRHEHRPGSLNVELLEDRCLLSSGSAAPLVGTTTISPDSSFVHNLYQDLLHRQVDSSGLVAWTGQLAQGASRAQVVQGIEASVEYRTNVVEHFYQTLLGRNADPAGLAQSVAFLGRGGHTEAVEAAILGSQEYFQKAGRTQTGFLTALYHDLLGRAVDPVGAAGWGRLLMAGGSRGQVVSGVLNSIEADRNQVKSTYQQLLHRAADNSGLATFLAFLQHGGTVESMITTIGSSPEFFARSSLPPGTPLEASNGPRKK